MKSSRPAVRHPLIGVTALALLLLGAVSVSAELSDATVRDRYHAILSAGEALTVSGEIRLDQQEAIAELISAWTIGDRDRFLGLLERAELRFGADVSVSAALQLVVDPDGEIIDGPKDARNVQFSLLEIHREAWIADPFLTDELALHQRLQRESAPTVIAVAFGPPDPNAEGFVPPRGWAERAMLLERWRRIADLAQFGPGAESQAAPPIILDGSLAPTHGAFRNWMAAERIARPTGPFFARGIDAKRAAALDASPRDHWIIEPASRQMSAAEAFRILARLRVARLDLIAPPYLPWFDILKKSLSAAAGSARVFAFADRRVTAIHSGRNTLFFSDEARPVRIEIIPIPGPIDGRIALLYEDGTRVEIRRVKNAATVSFDLPSNVITLVRIGREDDD